MRNSSYFVFLARSPPPPRLAIDPSSHLTHNLSLCFPLPRYLFPPGCYTVSFRLCPSLSVSVRLFPSLSVSFRLSSLSVSFRVFSSSLSASFRHFPSLSVFFGLSTSLSVSFRLFPSLSVAFHLWGQGDSASAESIPCESILPPAKLSRCEKEQLAE